MMEHLVALTLLTAAHRPWHDVWDHDINRFPSHAAAINACDFTLRHLQWIDQMIAFVPPSQVTPYYYWRHHTYEAWWLWDCLRIAHPTSGHCTAIRHYWLRDMRRRLSPADWIQGRMPTPGPLSYFQDR